jgi:hypothetical protein
MLKTTESGADSLLMSSYVLTLALVLAAWVALWWFDSGPGSERFHLRFRHEWADGVASSDRVPIDLDRAPVGTDRHGL